MNRTQPTLKQKLAGLLCAVLGLGFFGACGQSANSRSIIMAAPPASAASSAPAPASLPAQESEAPQPDEPPAEDLPLTLSVASRTISSGYSGNAFGCYHIITHGDTSADVAYVDYDARSMNFLPNLEQQVAGLAGKLAGVLGGVSPVWAGQHLFIFHQRAAAEDAGEAGAASVLRLNADGSEPCRCTFPRSMAFQLTGAALWDGEALIFIAQDYAGEESHYSLLRLNAASMEYEVLHCYEPGWEYSIEGYWAMGPIVLAAAALPPTGDAGFNAAWDNRSFTLFKQGMASGKRSDLFSYTQGQPVVVQGGSVYYWNADEGSLYALSAETGEATVLARGFAPERYDFAQMPTAGWGGLVRIEFAAGDGRNNSTFAINPATGAATQLHTEDLGENVSIFAEGEGVFLVRSGDKWVRRELVEPGYDPAADSVQSYDSRFVSMPEYALITAANFWAGHQEFIPIRDLIYGSGSTRQPASSEATN